MPVPILKQGGILIASIQSALTDADLVQLKDELAEKVGRYRSHGVVIDVTTLDVLDRSRHARCAASPRSPSCAALRRSSSGSSPMSRSPWSSSV